MDVTSRPIHFISNIEAVTNRLLALGLTRISGEPGDTWQVFTAPAGGRIGVHGVVPHSQLDGVSRLGFEVQSTSDLNALTEAFQDRPGGAVATLKETGHGLALEVKTRDGLSFLIDTGVASPTVTAQQPGVEIAQMWFTNDTPSAREVLLRLGARELVTTRGIGWDDTRLPGGGRTQLHATTAGARVSVGFMSAQPLELLKDQVDRTGEDAAIVDESWGRYLDLLPVTVNKPETGLDGKLTWVNEEMTDFYGYQVH